MTPFAFSAMTKNRLNWFSAKAVHSLHLLLFTQANTVLRHLSPCLHMDARRIVPLLHLALLRIALLPSFEELHALSSAYLADRSCISRQFLLLNSSSFWRPAPVMGYRSHIFYQVVSSNRRSGLREAPLHDRPPDPLCTRRRSSCPAQWPSLPHFRLQAVRQRACFSWSP